MATSLVTVTPRKALEDPLAYLPCSSVLEYRKGEAIYRPDQVHHNLYLVLTGTVKVTRVSDHGSQLLVDLYGADDFFGEAAFVNPDLASEQATAHSPVTLMAWKATEIEEIILKRPMLAVALLQAFGERSMGLTQRLESLSTDRIDRRLARSLIRFADRMGTQQEDGGVRMDPLTHELLAHYVGTSRELVTCHMTKFRKMGYLQYSRRAIVLYRDALNAWVKENIN